MVLFSLVASHSDLDLETVGTLSSGAASVAASVDLPAVTLATCNRLEIYAEAPSDAPEDVTAGQQKLLDAVAEASGLDGDTVAASFRTLIEDDAVNHLFTVGAGLDSAVIGEREIAGQVRRSLAEAQSAGTVSGNLTKLFESATRTAKDVGAKTALGTRGRSIVSVALDIASDMRSDQPDFYREAKAVLIGTGAYAGTSLAQLAERGVQDIGVFSGSGRAEQFLQDRAPAVAKYGSSARAVQMHELSQAFAEADLLIGCSGGNRQITAAEVQSLGRLSERTRPLTIVDLALSHDFDPEVAELDGVELITLESVKIAAPDEAAASLEQAHSVVGDSVEQFLTERRERTADDAIVALRKHTQQMLDAEMTKVRKQHGCTAAGDEVEFAMRRIVRKLLHIPTVRAREMAAEGRADEYVSALEALYGIEVSPREDSEREAPAMRRRAEEFSAAELAQMAAYQQQVPDGGFCRHHSAGEFDAERIPALQQLPKSA
ncbi:MAG: glutamyl-tRNA reductase [Nesterenkonia sp.]